MSELQGPRIPGEEGSRRRRPIGWIVAGLIALLLLALLIPFACQALTGGSDPQEGASGSQENTGAQDSGDGGDASDDESRGAAGGEGTDGDGAGEVAAAGENTDAQAADDGSSGGERATAQTDEAAGDGAGSNEGGSGERAGKPLPDTGGTSPPVLLALGTSLVAIAAGLYALARRYGPSCG